MFEKFKHRSYELERLDTGDYTDEEYERWQREMRFIHRIFGEIRAFRKTLFREISKNASGHTSILDVGAGSGDILREIRNWQAGGELFLVGAELDRFAVKNVCGNSIHAVACDALKLPFRTDSFDYVISSLFLHHLDDESANNL